MHCPQDIFDIVSQSAAATAEKRAQTVATKDNRDYRRNDQLLRELFPRMPAKTREEILEHGFQKGSGRVGRATRLDEEKRIELAVNAHIRHRLTDYEFHLKARRKIGNGSPNPRMEARQRVRGQVTKIAESWRADAHNAGIEPCQHPIQAAVCPVKAAGKPKHTVKLATTLSVDVKQSDGLIGRRVAKPSRKQRARAKINRRRKSRAESRTLLAGLRINPYLAVDDSQLWEILKLHRGRERSRDSLGSVVEERFKIMLDKRAAKVVTRELEGSVKQKAKKAAMAGGVYFGSHPRDKLKPELESLSRQSLEIPRPEERTPRTFAPTEISDSEMEGGEENVNSRVKDDLSSEYEPTDMSDKRELQDAEEIEEDGAEDTSEVEVFSSTGSGRTKLGSYTAKEVPLDKDFDWMDCS